jgi:hypothetical protein
MSARMGHELTNPALIPLFAGLRKDEVSVILAAATRRTFKGSVIIISAEEPATHLFLVTGGHVDYFVVTSSGEDPAETSRPWRHLRDCFVSLQSNGLSRHRDTGSPQ